MPNSLPRTDVTTTIIIMQTTHYLTINTVSELVCLIVAIISLANDKSNTWRSMILYLLVTCVVEFIGIAVESKYRNNQWVYNIFLVFEAGFNSLMFYLIFGKYGKFKKNVLAGFFIFIALYSYEIIKHGFREYNYLTYKVMSAIYVLYSLFFYFLLIRDDDYIGLKSSAVFWWTVGVLLFYFGNTACNLFDNSLSNTKIFGDEPLTYFIYKILNVLLYSCWSYSFICRKWLTTTSKA